MNEEGKEMGQREGKGGSDFSKVECHSRKWESPLRVQGPNVHCYRWNLQARRLRDLLSPVVTGLTGHARRLLWSHKLREEEAGWPPRSCSSLDTDSEGEKRRAWIKMVVVRPGWERVISETF